MIALLASLAFAEAPEPSPSLREEVRVERAAAAVRAWAIAGDKHGLGAIVAPAQGASLRFVQETWTRAERVTVSGAVVSEAATASSDWEIRSTDSSGATTVLRGGAQRDPSWPEQPTWPVRLGWSELEALDGPW